MANIYFQLSFSKTSRKQICRDYNLSPEDEILMAVWISDESRSVFDRYGFVITKNGLGWHYPAMAETSEKGNGNKERVPRNLNFIDKNNITFLGTDVRIPEVTKCKNGKYEIQLRISGMVYSFAFNFGIKQEKITALERIIAAHFSDCLDLSLYEKLDDSYSFAMTVLYVRDFFSECCRTIKEKFSAFKSRIDKGAQKIQSEETKNKAISAINKVGAFFRHIIDFATDIMLMFAILIFVKPELLIDNYIDVIAAKFLGQNIPQEIITKRNFIFLVLIVIFIILKLFISLSCRKNRKAVTALLLVMLVADFFLIQDKFLIFLILFLLILLSLQFSMGFSKRVIHIKSVSFIIVCIIGYFILHIILYDNFVSLLNSIYNTMRLPVEWW